MELDELNKSFKEHQKIAEKQEGRVNYYTTRAQLLTVSDFIFQGIIFLSISHVPSNALCKNWWLPLTLSLLSYIIYFITFLDAVTKRYRIQYHLDLTRMEQEILYAQIYSLQHHSIQIGDEWTVTTRSDRILKPNGVELLKRKVYIGIIVSATLAFTVVMLFDCRVSLWDVGSWSQGGGASDHAAVTAFKSSSP